MSKESDVQEMIDKVMDKLDIKLEKKGMNLKKRERDKFEKALKVMVSEFKTPAEAFGMSPKELENMYVFGYNLFKNGKYNDAMLMMRHLMQLDANNPRYALGAGAAYHQMKDYERANGFYSLASDLDQENPLPMYYMYDCFKKLNELHCALLMLDNVIARCGDKPEHAVLKERATLTRASLAQEILEADTNKKAASA